MDLVQRVAATIDRYGMFATGQTVGVAVSGGADSVCLLHVLVLLARDLRLHVLHLNHNLRGDESRGDAEFVRQLAATLGLPSTIHDAEIAPGNLEQSAREARLRFFREAQLDRVALGHTRSDQAETVLFRFLRGSGTAGLSGIRPVTGDGIVRPLLEIDRAGVERFLRDRSLSWREDSSNACEQFARNRIRHTLMPLLARDWNPAIASALSQTAEWAQAEEAYWEQELDRLSKRCLRQTADAVLLDVAAAAALPVAAARRLIRRAMERARGNLRGIDFHHVEAVFQLALRPQGHGHASVPGLAVVRSCDWLRLAPLSEGGRAQAYRIPAPVPGRLRLPGCGAEISLELIEKLETLEPSESVYNSGMGCLDWPSLSGSLEFRSWMPGDRYQPKGFSGVEKIKTLFQRARVPIWERRGWPVLWDGETIVWSRRFGPSVRVAARSTSTRILQIRDSAVG